MSQQGELFAALPSYAGKAVGSETAGELFAQVAGLTWYVHRLNRNWWSDPKTGQPVDRNVGEALMLMVSELAEAMEGDRKRLMDDKLPGRQMLEVELADCVIRILDFCGGKGLDLAGALVEKLEYNAHRADHKHAARLAPGGKQY